MVADIYSDDVDMAFIKGIAYLVQDGVEAAISAIAKIDTQWIENIPKYARIAQQLNSSTVWLEPRFAQTGFHPRSQGCACGGSMILVIK